MTQVLARPADTRSVEPGVAPPGTTLSVAREAHATRRATALAILATAVAAGGAFLLMRALSDQLPDARPTLPVVYALSTCGAALSAFLLAVRSQLHEHRPLAWVALGYGIATVAMALQTLGFPGFLRDGGPLNTTSSGAAALYLIWHIAVSVCTLMALRAGDARRPLLLTVAAGFAAAIIYASWGGSLLPTIVRADGTYTPLALGWSYAVVVLSVVTLVAWLRRLGRRPPWTETWVGISLALSTWDVVLHALAQERFNEAWWSSLSMRSAQYLVLAIGLLATFVTLHRALERADRDMVARLDRSEAATRERQRALAAAHMRIGAAMVGDALRIVFQPIADLATGRVVGTEALARFTAQPRRRPDEWFAEAQSIGRGVELELNAIRRALDRIGELPDTAYLGLNVSPAVIVSGGLTSILAHIPGERLVIEITEHDPVDDYAEIVRCLEPLRSRGVRLAIDDAGAGFASLRHITLLMPDIIKLDVSLTSNVHDDVVAQALVRSLISFAGHTGATIVAEGIETRAQLEALRSLGVSRGQGYLLGRPADLPLNSALSGSPA